MRRTRNALFALGAAICALLAGCGAGREKRETQPPAGGESAELVAPRAVVEAAPDGADPLLSRVRALAARRAATRASRDDADSGAPPSPGTRVPSTGRETDATPRGALPSATGPRPGLASLLPPLGTGAGRARSTDERAARAFVLGAGDEVDLVVSGQPEFSGVVTVRADGTVALPTTGDIVRAGGLTEGELAEGVAGAVSPRYVKAKPAVSAVVRRSPRLVYYVFGAVRRPGRYDLPPGGVSALDAVMRASVAPRAGGVFDGGRALLEFVPVEGAVYARVRVVAPGGGEGAVRIVDVARAMRGGAGALDSVRAGEIVIVPAASGEWGEEELERELTRPTRSARPSQPTSFAEASGADRSPRASQPSIGEGRPSLLRRSALGRASGPDLSGRGAGVTGSGLPRGEARQ